MPAKIDGSRAIRIKADIDHWYHPAFPPIFQNNSYNWYRSQLMFYLLRFNSQTLAHVQKSVAQYFNPPSISAHYPYVAVYVRRSDKVRFKEMSQAYKLQDYFHLFDADARQAKIRTVYLNSEDESVFNEFQPLNEQAGGYYKLIRIQATKNVVFMSLVGMPTDARAKIVMEFLTDLFIEANADLHAGTLTSNWCRLVDEIKLAVGRVSPYYTPENKYIIDM